MARPRWIARVFAAALATIVLGVTPSEAQAICMAQSMSGRWVNMDPNGVIQRATVEFKCCDVVAGGRQSCSPPADLIKFQMPCGTTSCEFPFAVGYTFTDVTAGYHVTRMDGRLKGTNETREAVLVLLPDGRLMVHWSIDYGSGSSNQDFSLVEYFERQRCVTFDGREFCFMRQPILQR
jgi:hypothetical protein